MTALEPYGAAFKAADTTVRKDQIRTQAQDRARAMLDGKRMVFRALVHDVRTVKPGLVRIAYIKMDLRPFDPEKKPVQLRTQPGAPLIVPLTDEEALRISKDMVLEMTGTARFGGHPGPFSGNYLETPNPAVVSVSLSADINSLGTIWLDGMTWRTYARNAAGR